MVSWAQQKASLRAAAEGRPAQARSRSAFPRAAGNGNVTRAGQLVYSLRGESPPNRQFSENQPLIREGPSDYIQLNSGVKKLVRSLQPDGSYRLTRLGKAVFKDKWTDYLAHVPVKIRGTRRRGRNAGRAYERQDYLPVSLLNVELSRQGA